MSKYYISNLGKQLQKCANIQAEYCAESHLLLIPKIVLEPLSSFQNHLLLQFFHDSSLLKITFS